MSKNLPMKNRGNCFRERGRHSASSGRGPFSSKDVGKFQVLQVNSRLDDPKEVSRLIRNPWIREFSECVSWQEGGEKLNKFNKIVMSVKTEGSSVSKLDLREKLTSDLMILGKELTIKIREETFSKITPDKDTLWLRSMAQDVNATLKDRTESCSILINQNPILYTNEMRVLQGILDNASNKTGFLKMIDTILSMLIEGSVFPKSRELSFLQNHHKLRPLMRDQSEVTMSTFEFVQIYFESFLKEWFASFTNVLLRMLNDSLWTIRKKIITVIYHLASSVVEQRCSLVNSLVHKFGDREDKVASHSTFLLGELVKNHGDFETMSMVLNVLSDHISRNLDSFHKSLNSASKATLGGGNSQVTFRQVYRLILFISEIKLSKNYNYFSLETSQSSSISSHPPPVKILRLCLSSLKVIVESKAWSNHSGSRGKVQQSVINEPLYRLLRVTLNCINRSLPYAESQIKMINDKSSNQLLQEFETIYIPKLYYLCHNIPCGSIRIVILGVLYRISKILDILSDRYYRLLYSQLLYKPIYTSKNKKLLVFLIWQIVNDPITSYKVSLSILKRSLQISLHSSDVAMLTCLLVILVNVVNYRRFSRDVKKNNDEFDLETTNIKLLSGTVKELILKSDDRIMNEDEDENFVDVEEEETRGMELVGSVQANKSILNCMQKGGGLTGTGQDRSYDSAKRDPKYSNSENIHFWEAELLKSHYHPFIVELVYKSIAMCQSLIDDHDKGAEYHGGMFSSIFKFMENFSLLSRVGTRRSAEGDQGGSIPRIFEVCSLKLFMQILSYNPVDLDLILFKSLGQKSKDVLSATCGNTGRFKRISAFSKWSNKHIPSYLDFYKTYFQDPIVKAVDLYNNNLSGGSDSIVSRQEDDELDNFEVDYDETSGKMIKSNKYHQEDFMVDSLIDGFYDHKRDETQDSDYEQDLLSTDDDGDIDLLQGVNIDDFDLDQEQDEEEDDLDLLIDDTKKRKPSIKEKLPNLKRFKSNSKKKFPDTITYVDADEMEEYLV